LKPIEVLIYDDNNDMRDGLAHLISRTSGLKLSGAFADCMATEAQVKKLQPDVILMDIDMTVISGIQDVQLISQFDTDVKILMITVFVTYDLFF
jgi:DNA-binding NarL/FixJ family response regulator